MTITTFEELLKYAKSHDPYPWYDMDRLLGKFQIDTFWDYDVPGDIELEFKEKPLYTWTCTDTEVGYKAHYFKDELFAITYQSARKSGVEWYWFNEMYSIVELYIRSHVAPRINNYKITDGLPLFLKDA